MQVLVLGATGATGRLLVEQLLDRGHNVRAVVRDTTKLSDQLLKNDKLAVIPATLLDLSDAELAQAVDGCQAVASCLGHNMSWKGIYGRPRRLVTDTMRQLTTAVKMNQPGFTTRFVLMNTAGNYNQAIDQPIGLGQRIVMGLIRLLLPPHVDNEEAADYLSINIGQTEEMIEWAVVRPDSLTDEDTVTEYSVYPSPIRSAIFNAGTTSRINVAHFMADLLTDDETWVKWKGQMPVIYNRTERTGEQS